MAVAKIESIRPTELDARRRAGKVVRLVDVRTPAEFRTVHADIARPMPLDALDPGAIAGERNGDPSEPLYVICRTGSRGRKACEKLRSAGLDHVVNVEGGTEAWEAAGLPVVVGQVGVSIERQVRITAGALVLIGSALGWVVHPAFMGLPAFVGAGLVFAGVTNTCGMGMLLLKMPWNTSTGQRRACAC